ncbi:hypothetical protein [Tianweitania sediminis]|uniref:Uncharacterized protein n=1 Tax=Tianweitania sediminis TaxID=1502156 RepID=A0A8J7UJS1_9HYPH|nr:hypothetical protein [Tianweitania sediminis]MBP0439125.1 hypothetical protein [Tianweitania sediminis]
MDPAARLGGVAAAIDEERYRSEEDAPQKVRGRNRLRPRNSDVDRLGQLCLRVFCFRVPQDSHPEQQPEFSAALDGGRPGFLGLPPKQLREGGHCARNGMIDLVRLWSAGRAQTLAVAARPLPASFVPPACLPRHPFTPSRHYGTA